jgi:hypothetical protein
MVWGLSHHESPIRSNPIPDSANTVRNAQSLCSAMRISAAGDTEPTEFAA